MDPLSDDDELGEEEPSRARELLANFYGRLSENSPAPSGGDETSINVQLKDDNIHNGKDAIDREVFDADGYVREMLERKKLQELLKADDAMCREIKTLSGDMQALVYENYSRFISATDTIRDMKQNVGALEDEMQSLMATMKEIDATSTAVNSSLADKRSQIDKLVRARRLLKRLEFLFELPRRLSAAASNKQYKEAVRYYAMTEEILKRYERVPSLGEIHKECSRIADKLRTTLEDSFSGTTEKEMSEFPKDLPARVELLLRLGGKAASTERAAYASAFAHLNWLLQSCCCKNEKQSPPRFAASVASAVAPAFVAVADSLIEVSAVVDKVITTTEKNDDTPKKKEDRPSIDEFALVLFGDYVDAVERSLDAAVIIERKSFLEQKFADSAISFYQDARQALEVAGDCLETAAAKCGVGDLLRMKLQRLGRRAAARRLDDLASTAKLRAATSIGEMLKNQDNIRTICLHLARRLAATGEIALERASPLFEFLDDVDIEDAATEYLRFVLKFVAAAGNISIVIQAAHNDDFQQRILDPPPSLESLLNQAANGWLSVPTIPALKFDETRSLLILGAVLKEFPEACKHPGLIYLEDDDENTVNEDSVTANDDSTEVLRRPSSSAPTQRLRLVDVVQIDQFQNTSSLLLARYVRLSSAILHASLSSSLCRLAFSSSMNEEPTSALKKFLQDIHRIAALLGTALGEDTYLPELDCNTIVARPRPASADEFGISSGSRLVTSSAHRVGGIELDVERLFSSQGDASKDDALHDWTYLGGHTEWSATSTAAALLKLLAISLLEQVRTITLSTTAHYLQLDLDARYILAVMDHLLRAPNASPDATKDIERLLSDFLQSASERALSSTTDASSSVVN